MVISIKILSPTAHHTVPMRQSSCNFDAAPAKIKTIAYLRSSCAITAFALTLAAAALVVVAALGRML
jgi:hypothetical protein